MIEPRKIGRFLELDHLGLVKPDVDLSLIGPSWKPVVKAVTQFLMKTEKVSSVYIRGSVPRGLAIENISDVDFIYIAEESLDEVEKEIEVAIRKRFPYVRELELFRITKKNLFKIRPPQKRPYLQMLLKTQSLFLAGEDVIKDVDQFKPGIEMVSHIFSLSEEFSKLPEWQLKDSGDKDKLADGRKWFCRRVVRAGLEITLNRATQYTRDLYFCYEQFAKFYPQKRHEMYNVLVNCLNGHEDPLNYGDLVSFLDKELARELGVS